MRQSSVYQMSHNLESQKLQYAMQDRLQQLGWREIEVIDEDLGRSAAGTVVRSGFERMVAQVCLGHVGAVAAREVSRFARNSRDWQQLVEVCRVVDTVLVDQEAVYLPRQSNDRLLLGLKGSLNEYELDLLRQRSLEARYEKARCGELIVAAPVGYLKTGESFLEKGSGPACATGDCVAVAQVRRNRVSAANVTVVSGAWSAAASPYAPRRDVLEASELRSALSLADQPGLLEERKLPPQDEVFGRSSQPRPQDERRQRDEVGSQSQNHLDKDDHGFVMPYTIQLASSRPIE